MIDTIIGRIKEKQQLQAALNSSNPEFIAIYGRRRVGKTYLIKKFFQKKNCIFFQTTGIYNGKLRTQLEQFTKELSATFYQNMAVKTPVTWMEAFNMLSQALSNKALANKKLVLFFDELPWLATQKSNIVSALEYYWNRYWVNQNNIKLVVCGSLASWLIANIIKNKGGLHNRITKKIRLLPFTLQETKEYLDFIKYNCNLEQTTKIYMVTGGVPFYLKNFNHNLSIDQNINELFFNIDGMFFHEFDEIFLSLFDNSEQYKEIVALIAKTRLGVSRKFLEANNKLTGVGGRLTSRLETLEQAGFISGYLPYGYKNRGIYYRVNDEYCYFYYTWILPIKNKLKQNAKINYWQKIVNTPAYYNWMGYAFENICYKHLPQIRKKLNIDDSSLASPWRMVKVNTDSTQIDLLFDRIDNAITICEIKYSNNKFNIDKQYAKVLQQKLTVFMEHTNTKKQIFLAMITANGLKNTTYAQKLINGETVVLKDLFNEKI